MSLERLIESRIKDAMSAGAFDRLSGEGKPLRGLSPADNQAGDQWLGFKILQNADMLPPWLMLAREIERDAEELRKAEQRLSDFIGLAASTGDWDRYGPAVRRMRTQFERCVRELRSRQDRFNLDAPSIRLERPQIWVEARLEQVDERMRAAGAPWLQSASV